MRSPENEELRRPREGLQKNAIATDWILLFEQLRRSGIGERQQLTGAGHGPDVGLQYHGPLGFKRPDQVAMHIGERLDQNIHLAAAAQADRPGEVVAHAVVKQAGGLAFEDGLRLLEDLAFEASAADRAGDFSRLADRHPRAGRPGSAAPGTDHGRHRDRVTGAQPRVDLAHDITHVSKCSQPCRASYPAAPVRKPTRRREFGVERDGGLPFRAAGRRAPRDWRDCGPAESRRRRAVPP